MCTRRHKIKFHKLEINKTYMLTCFNETYIHVANGLKTLLTMFGNRCLYQIAMNKINVSSFLFQSEGIIKIYMR